MTQEDKAKAYDEAIERVRIAYKDEDRHLKATLERIFPELKESEDERTRKGLIKGLSAMRDIHKHQTFSDDAINIDDAIAWLEKQGRQKEDARWEVLEKLLEADSIYQMAINDVMVVEAKSKAISAISELSIFDLLGIEKQSGQKPNKNIIETWKDMRLEVYQQASGNRHEPNYSDDTTKMFSLNDIDEIIEKMNEQNLSDKVEPKFKNGQWIVWQDKCYKVNYNGCGYELVDQNGLSTSLEYGTIGKNAHLWDITKDAKDGDVIVHNNCTFIFMGIKDGIVQALEENLIDDANPVSFGEPNKNNDYHPATKEQRDLLFQKMKEAGYEWDAEKKELKKIEQKPVECNVECNNVLMTLDEAIEHCDLKSNNTQCGLEHRQLAQWLRELKKYKEQRPVEWSEEDVKIIKRIDSLLYAINESDFEEIHNWLKSLCPQSHWEPSKELKESSNAEKANQIEPNETESIRKEIFDVIAALPLSDKRTGMLLWLEQHKYLRLSHWRPTEEQMKAIMYAKKRLPDTEVGNYKEGVLDELYEQLKAL